MNYRKQADNLAAIFSARFRKLGNEVAETVYKLLRTGVDPERAVAQAFLKHNVESWMLSTVTDSVVKSALYGYGVAPSFALLSNQGLTAKVLSMSYGGSAVEFSKRIHGTVNIVQQTVTETLRASIESGKGVQSLATQLFDGYGYGYKLDLPGVQMHKKLAALAMEEKKRVRTLTKLGVPTPRASTVTAKIGELEAYTDGMSKLNLRTSYKQLLTAIKGENEKAIAKSLYVAMQEKARSQVMMIAQTEMSHAYGKAFESRSVLDPDVAGIRYYTSAGHDIYDICDYHTSVDYGYGPGVYPLKSIPDYPFHPRCTCQMEEIFIGEIPEGSEIDAKKEDRGGKKFLNSLPTKKREALLGVAGNKEFKSGRDWKENLRNYKGHREAVTNLKPEDFKGESGIFERGRKKS